MAFPDPVADAEKIVMAAELIVAGSENHQ